MNLYPDYPLKSNNSFNVEVFCQQFYQPESLNDLAEIANSLSKPFYILGEGTNTLFFNKQIPTVISPKLYGKVVEEFDEFFQVTASASENWHELVKFCIDKGVYGLENLALIPGSVGAAPVQNIGAYGVEFADFCYEIKWFDFELKKLVVMKSASCKFAYRESLFKGELNGKGIIVEVTLRLSKSWQPNISYRGLDTLEENASARQVMDKVIEIRQSKLPDPNILPNAGSFFKNPIVPYATFEALNRRYPDMPYYKVDEQNIKLAAGWLIEHSGLKGYKTNGVGVHQHQALVLVNFSSESGADVLALATFVVNTVKAKFDIQLEPEVRLVGANSEQKFSELCNHG